VTVIPNVSLIYNKQGFMKLTKAQQEIVDRYMEATKDTPESRMPIEQLLKLRKAIPKSRPDNAMLRILEEQRLASVTDIEPVEKGRPKNVVKNSMVLNFLEPYFDMYSECVKDHYWIDDIFTGVSRLDLGGNTRDLSKYHLFDVLCVCASIDVDFIKEYLSIGERQAQKYMVSLQIAHRMVKKEIIERNLVVVQ
jgi:hypothetical protein